MYQSMRLLIYEMRILLNFFGLSMFMLLGLFRIVAVLIMDPLQNALLLYDPMHTHLDIFEEFEHGTT